MLRGLYLGDPNTEANVDTLIRGDNGDLEPYDLNSTAFVEWYKEDVGVFDDASVILLGVGGVGEPIAKKIALEKPRSMTLVDLADKTEFAAQLARENTVDVRFEPLLKKIIEQGLPANAVVINAAGKEGAKDESELSRLIKKGAAGGVFVDIRPHLDIAIVEEAKQFGWNAYTGHGMNARNDYVLLQGIARQTKVVPPSFERFEQLVAAAS